jgi:uncharacterized membrane protein YedE/YeeE
MQIGFSPVLGGALIGVAATMLLACNGRIAGVSGIVNGIGSGVANERWWRILFLVGLMGAAAIMLHFVPSSLPQRPSFPPAALIIAGLLVGFGTRMGNGCTSGHGVCGLGRLSARSAVAVLVFLATAMATVLITRHMWNLLP